MNENEEIKEQAEEVQDQPEQPEEQPKEPEKEDERITNLRLIAQAKERVEQENKQLANQNKQLQEKLARLKEFDDEDEPSVQSSKLSQEIAELKQQIYLGQVEKKIVSKYPDFSKVADTVNMNIMQARYPEEYNKIMAEENLVKRADLAYDAVKKLRIYTDPSDSRKEVIEKNLKKPRVAGASAAASKSPLDMLRTREGQEELRRKALEAEARL